MASGPDLPVELPRSGPARWRRWWPGHWAPLLAFWSLWVVAALAAWRLHATTGGSALLPAVAETIEFRIAARQPERLLAMVVEAGDLVHKGDLLAVQDGSALTRELAVLAAQLTYAEAQMHTEALALGRERITDEGVFKKTIDQAEIGLLGAKVDAERDRAELDGVRIRLKLWSKWIEDRMASAQTAEDLRAQAVVLERRIGLRDQVVASWQNRVAQMRDRLGHFQQYAVPDPPRMPGDELAAHRAMLEVARTRLAAAAGLRDQLLLRAPADGVVSEILLRTGDVPTVGAPVLTLRDPHPKRVVAYGDSVQLRDLVPGRRVRVSPRDDSGQSFAGRIVSLALGAGAQPPQLPLGVYGRQMWAEQLIVAVDGAALRPGQVVDVIVITGEDPLLAAPPPLAMPEFAAPLPALSPQLAAPATATSGGPAEVKLPGSGDPRPLTLPSELTAVTRFEPSGWLWMPQWRAWLTVSDDTGWPDRQDHAPWLFRIAPTGEVAAAPIVVAGLDRLDDIESLARDSSGTIWMLASQSTNRHGKRSPARTSLLRAAVDGEKIAVTGHVSLVRALAQLPDHTLRSLGLQAADPKFAKGVSRFDRLLDIEGMTVVGGELWLGLKKPSAADGAALAWRLRDPEALLRTGRLQAGQLTALPPLGLRAGPAGADRPATISDWLNLSDGRLAVLAVASPPGPGEQMASALWLAQLKADGWQLKRIRDFEGVHAEGVALGPTPGVLAVVFDRSSEVPLWVEVAVTP